jgi:hypothetical protein
VPRYCNSVPLDPFDEEPIRYRRGEVGYVLYSVSHNQKDDGGFPPGAWQLGDNRNSRYDVTFAAPPFVQPE